MGKKNGRAPIQHDVTHCGLFVCAGIDSRRVGPWSFLRKAWDVGPSSEDIGSIGQILVSLRLVCSNQDLFHCLAIIQHGTPSASIFGLIVGAIIGVSGLEKLSHLPSIHGHHSNQLRAITSMLGNCCKVNFALFAVSVHFDLISSLLEPVLFS